MSLMLLLALICVAAIAGWRRRRRLSRWLTLLTLVLFLAIACGPVPRLLLHDLQDSYASMPSGKWAARNAIVVLGVGTTRASREAPLEPPVFAYGRLAHAAILYRDCKASGQQCMVLVTGGDPQKHGSAEAQVYAVTLRKLGVADNDLQVEPRSMTTWQNAQFTRPMLLTYAPQRMLLLTSGFHMRRSLLYFAHFGMNAEPVRGDEINATTPSWPDAWNIALCDVVLHEYAGIARYHIYNVLGWNAPPVLTPAIPATR
ncbi:YdcF family protein [Rhodanobacter sp. L36]|uniref:YdcF family protein n=1 Tax=Rhodanobacter sp. L36 TaxID=1747221 RepID=UPI00131E5D95|nr:YdcF family protein [Rhodanobacter sp. L36]